MRSFAGGITFCFALSMQGAGASETAYERTIRVDFRSSELVLTDAAGAKIKAYPVALPKHKVRLPVEGVVADVIVGAEWRPTEKTRAAYFRRTGKILPKVVPPGHPKNAMGAGKITIDFVTPRADPTIRIHGTNDPASIGNRVTRGCIRLNNADWLELAGLVKDKKTRVVFE